MSHTYPVPPSLQTAALRHYTGCKVEDLLPLAESLNAMLKEPWESQNTVRTKYSHM